MNDIELAQWLIDKRHEVNTEIDLITERQDEKALPLFKKLLQLNNALVEVFWELMILRERQGKSPLTLTQK